LEELQNSLYVVYSFDVVVAVAALVVLAVDAVLVVSEHTIQMEIALPSKLNYEESPDDQMVLVACCYHHHLL